MDKTYLDSWWREQFFQIGPTFRVYAVDQRAAFVIVGERQGDIKIVDQLARVWVNCRDFPNKTEREKYRNTIFEGECGHPWKIEGENAKRDTQIEFLGWITQRNCEIVANQTEKGGRIESQIIVTTPYRNRGEESTAWLVAAFIGRKWAMAQEWETDKVDSWNLH